MSLPEPSLEPAAASHLVSTGDIIFDLFASAKIQIVGVAGATGGVGATGTTRADNNSDLTAVLETNDDHLEHLQRLSTDEERRAFFLCHVGFATRTVVESLTARATSLLRVDPREAENLIGTSFWLAERLDDDFARGKANRAFANLVHLRGDQSEALVHYARAKELLLANGCRARSRYHCQFLVARLSLPRQA